MGTRLPTDRWGTPGPATSRAMMLAGHAHPATTVGSRRWSHPIAVGIAALGFAVFAFYLWTLMTDGRWAGMHGVDRTIYHDAVERVLSGGSWFLSHQVTGQPYQLAMGDVMYPPVAIPWLSLTLVPWPIWWIVPLGIIAAVVIRWRPSPWGWAAIATCFVFPPVAELIVAGNPGMWIAAFVALGTVWRPAFALVFLKPIGPALIGLLGIRSPRWWALVVVGTVISFTALMPLTWQWFGVVLNARGGFSGLTYALRDGVLMLVPLTAWAARTRPFRG